MPPSVFQILIISLPVPHHVGLNQVLLVGQEIEGVQRNIIVPNFEMQVITG